jgi:glycosyltransferase involved in cell wall biosynthesis
MTAVSIIIPTHNRRDRIVQTLAAIAEQTYPLDQIEVVVVADGCQDDTVVHLHTLTCPFALQVHEQPGSGPAVARNLGAAYASGDLLIFIDDDIEVMPGFVTAHVSAHQPPGQTVAMGHLPMATPAQDSFFTQGIRSWWNGKFFKMSQPGYRFSYDDLFSGNFSISAILFAQVDGFDTALWCHEDYELGLRLLEAGAIFVYAANATGIHHDSTDMARVLRRHYAEGKADVYLIQAYPQLAMRLPISTASYSLLSRTLRFLAFKRPSLGDRLADFLLNRLALLERLWLNGAWSYLFFHLHDYWYWRGVADHVDNPAAVRQFFTQQEPSVPPIPELTIDLADGLDAAARTVDEKRPSSLRLCINNQLITDLPAEIGKERLRGGHLQWLLTTHLSGKTLQAMAMDKAQGMNGRLPLNPATITDTKADLQNDPQWVMDQYYNRNKKVVEIELTKPLQPIDVTGYSGLHALVSYQGKPINWVTLVGLESKNVSSERMRQAITDQIGWSIVPVALNPLLQRQHIHNTSAISVIVCTRDRADQLKGCLDALLAQDYANFEIIVVDNASQTAATAQLAARLPVRYVREERPGLDWARNRGIAEARYEIVAFTDDDARPDRGWLQAIANAFVEPEVTAVTGPALPALLETPAQNLFEFSYGGMSHGFKRRFVRRQQGGDSALLWASSFGVGANMAFRRACFDKIGQFDVALDVGTPSAGGGDIEMFHRLVAQGHTLVYEPAAFVWHQHRPEMRNFKKLVQNNGRSFGCYLLTCLRNRTVRSGAIFHFALRHWFIDWIVSRLRQPKGFPRKFVWLELAAFLTSPIAYRRAQHQAAQIAHQSVLNTNPIISPAIESLSPQKTKPV